MGSGFSVIGPKGDQGDPGSVNLGDSVESETTFGISADFGTSANASRDDHTHGTPDADAWLATKTQDDLGDGATYVRTENNYDDAAAALVALVHQRPDWIPPNIRYKDADEIYVEKGRYYKMGYRVDGQYQNPTADYWDVAARTAVDIDAAYSAGSTSGMIGAAEVVSSWYSVFLMADDPIVLVLPYVRVDTISYGAPSTTITPAAHNDGTTAENGFIVANDAWNNYRLVKLDKEDAAYDGAVYTIADSATGTPDSITITGDITAQVAAADWLQLIPPSGTDCCYLGTIRINSSGNIDQFIKFGWVYSRPYAAEIAVNGTKGASAAAASVDMGPALPPTATTGIGYCIMQETTANRGFVSRVYYGSSATLYTTLGYHDVTSCNDRRLRVPLSLPIQDTAKLKQHGAYYDTSSNEVAIAAGGTFLWSFTGWSE